MSLTPKSVLILASGFLTMLVFGSIYTFGALTPYISSYLYYHNDPTSSTTLSLLFTLTHIFINFGTFICTTYLTNLPNRLLCIIAILGMSSCVFAVSFVDKFIGFAILYGFAYGSCIGVGYFVPTRNAYLHLPNRKGLCSGVIMSGFGLGSALFNLIILSLINPNNVKVDIQTGQYP